MPAEIRCPACGESEALRGEPEDDSIRITCERCGESWIRGLERRCSSCSEVLRPVPKALMGRARGNQRSIAGTMTIHLCPNCDEGLLEKYLRTRAPIPPKQWSAKDEPED